MKEKILKVDAETHKKLKVQASNKLVSMKAYIKYLVENDK